MGLELSVFVDFCEHLLSNRKFVLALQTILAQTKTNICRITNVCSRNPNNISTNKDISTTIKDKTTYIYTILNRATKSTSNQMYARNVSISGCNVIS